MLKNRILHLLFASLFLTCCSSIYMPNVPNTPMLSQQGEFSGGLHGSLKGNFSLNGAYAVSDHFGVLASTSYMNMEKAKRDYKHKLFEVGGGYFNTFGPDDNRIIEIYAGYGNAKTNRVFRNYDDNDVLMSTDFEEATYNKTFLQVNYSSKKSTNLRLLGHDFPINSGTALRITSAEMKTFMRNGIGQLREGNLFLEPIFFTRMKVSETVQLQYTTSGTFGLNSREFMNANNSLFTIGAVINVGRKKN